MRRALALLSWRKTMEGDCLNVAQQTHFKVAPTPRVRGAKGISDERCFVFIMYGAKRHNSQSISSCIDLETLREMSSQSGLYNLRVKFVGKQPNQR